MFYRKEDEMKNKTSNSRTMDKRNFIIKEKKKPLSSYELLIVKGYKKHNQYKIELIAENEKLHKIQLDIKKRINNENIR